MTTSNLDPATAIYNETILPGDGWMREIPKNHIFRITDLEGNQAVDTLFFNAFDPDDHYCPQQTIRSQKNSFLTTGSRLLSIRGTHLLTIIADTCGRHDTLGGACAAESNMVRYALQKRHMHNCRDTFLLQIARFGRGFTKRHITNNINFFMNVPLTSEGGLTFADGISAPGKYVELRAECDVICLISNCAQLNNPCNAYNPTPVQVTIWPPIS